MSVFGDTEPEDAWQADDPVAVLIDNLFRRLALLEGERVRDIRAGLLDIIDHRLSRYELARGGLSPADQVRLDLLLEDVAFVRGRL